MKTKGLTLQIKISLFRRRNWLTGIFFTLVLFLFISGTGRTIQSSLDNTWEVSTPAREKVNPEPLTAMAGAVRSGGYRNVHSILLVKNGKLIVEDYFAPFNRRILQYTASVSKSVGSILLGILLQQNSLIDVEQGLLDTPLSEILPKYADLIGTDPRKKQILFRHVLTMSAGFVWDEESFPYSDPENDWNAASRSRDPVAYVLKKPMAADPGKEFNYNGGLSIILSYLIEQSTGQRADKFAKKFLFDPLGIKNYRWDTLSSGLTDTDGGLHLYPRDMAKLGYLYLNKGVWNGQRIVPENWVAESTKEHQINANSPNYGFQWWCGDFYYNFKSIYVFLASGYGGQMIFVLPSIDTVVVFTHQVFDNPYGELNNTSLLSRYILPAYEKEPQENGPLQLKPSELRAYAGSYESKSEHLTISLKQDRLFAVGEDGRAFEIFPLSPSRFRGTVLDLVDVSFEFSFDEEKKIKAVAASFGFDKKEFTRID